jgi:hypothetical protein
MRKVMKMTAVLVAAVVFFLLLTLPPRPQAAAWSGDPELPRRTVSGAYHIHTTRSDGAGDRAAVAAAAARAGLSFVIITDHGDGTRAPDAPAYIEGVLCLDGVEISTNGGHYVALGMDATPYPLGGEASAVVEDVARFGGFGFAAHPDSARPELAWSDWTAPVDGLEWLSADSEWRDESRARLARVLFDYKVRPGPALASMLDRPEATLKRWDALTAQRQLLAIAGHDAHGSIGRAAEQGGALRFLRGVPSYEASFRTFTTRVILDTAPGGEAGADARLLLDAIRRGRMFTVIDALATPGVADLRGWQGAEGFASKSPMGSRLPAGPSVISAAASLPSGAEMVLINDGGEFRKTTDGHHVTGVEPANGAVRMEVRLPGAPGTPPVPWLVTNPIYFLPPASPPATPPPDAATFPLPADPSWHVEKDPHSTATMRPGGGMVTLDYTLSPGDRVSQFVALVADLQKGAPPFSGLTFTASASRPARMSVQIRYRDGAGERWVKSVYLDSNPRHIVVALQEMRPADHHARPAPDPSTAASLLFVVDLTNARPGDANTIRIGDVRVAR